VGRKRCKLPQVSDLQAVQLILDLPQFRINPGTRVLDVETGKTGRILMWYRNHIVSFPGGRIKSVPRHLLVEIQ